MRKPRIKKLTKSSALLCEVLKEHGFSVTEHLLGMPTAFQASWGEGKPVIGVLGEFDALPNLSQVSAATEKIPVNHGAPGHGCGHNLIGTGALAATLTVKKYLERTGKPGTIVYYGCSAEENNGSKPYMAREGIFKNVDCVFGWHPSHINALATPHVAITEISYRFYGKTSHAAAAPQYGRNALSAVELMNIGCNYLREQLVDGVRMHYAYKDSGTTASNIIQDYVEITYNIRAPKNAMVQEVIARVNQIARGAAIMTETRVEHSTAMGYSDVICNNIMMRVVANEMAECGAPDWNDRDYAFAKSLTAAYDKQLSERMENYIQHFYPKDRWQEKRNKPINDLVMDFEVSKEMGLNRGSSDVGDVCYVTPTAYFFVATMPIGAPGHSWYMTSSAGSGLGHKGMLKAGEIIALACTKVIEQPEKILPKAKAEWLETTGDVYDCPEKEIPIPTGR